MPATREICVKVICLGAGGHAKVALEILQSSRTVEIFGFLDSNPNLWHSNRMGVPILGADDMLPGLFESGITHAFVGVGSTGQSHTRRRLYEQARNTGFTMVPCIHATAVVSPSVEVGDGPTIFAGAVVNAAARIGRNVIVNTGAIIEHDCVIGDHSHIAPGARLASGVFIEEGAHVGIGATVRQSIRVGRNAIIGVGAAVVRDVPDNTVVVGVPARPIRRVTP